MSTIYPRRGVVGPWLVDDTFPIFCDSDGPGGSGAVPTVDGGGRTAGGGRHKKKRRIVTDLRVVEGYLTQLRPRP